MAQAVASVGATSTETKVDHATAVKKVYLEYMKN